MLVFIESQTPPLTPPLGGEGNRGLHSTEHLLTLHGASAYAPRCIGSRSTEHRATLHVASADTACCVKPPPSSVVFRPFGAYIADPNRNE